MTAGGLPAERRVSDADRQRIAGLLREQVTYGTLDLDDLEDRLGLVWRARTVADLVAVTADLDLDLHRPEPPPARSRRSILRNKGFQYHAAAYGFTNTFLLGTWAVTGHGFFWPFFPAAGWGVGLGMHGLAARFNEEKRAERAATRHQKDMVKSIEPEAAGRGGPALVAARPATVRRYVAVMFTDIANSTQLNELLGDPEWSRVRSRHRKLLQECFAAHAGAEVGSQGDGALARFAQPIDAVSCAIDIQRRLDHQREDAGFAPTVRIGVHAGDAVEDEGDLVGRVVNVAARVMTEAAPGEILVTESVAEHLDGRHEVEGRGLHTLKGVARPRHLLAVRWS